MIALRGRQPEWLAAIHEDLKTRSRLLCIAPGGVGKTTLFAALAADMWAKGIRTLVLENRDRLTEQTAERIRTETGLEVDVEKGDQRASPHAPIVVACVQSLSKPSRLTGFSDTHFGLVVADECFPSTVKVDGRPINEIMPGDLVTTYNHAKQRLEMRRVRASSVSIPSSLVELNLSSGRSICCTKAHPFFTQRGYQRAIDLTNGDYVATRRNRMQQVRSEDIKIGRSGKVKNKKAEMREVQKGGPYGEANSKTCAMQILRDDGCLFGMRQVNEEPERNPQQWRVLQRNLPRHVDESEQSEEIWRTSGRIQQEAFPAKNAGKQSDEESCILGEDESLHEGQDISQPRGEWIPYGSAGRTIESTKQCPDGARYPNSTSIREISITPNLIQGGYSYSGGEAGDRGGRTHPQDEEVEVSGSQEDGDIEFLRVDSVKILEQGRVGGYGAMCPDGRVYNLEVEGNNNYFADGILVHNCHLALSPSWLRIIRYCHWGSASLADDWIQPETYTPKCAVVGFTASPDLGTRRNLGEIFQGPKPTVNYSYLEAIEEGWLVGIKEENIPIKIDTRKFRVKRSAEGDTFSVEDQNAVLIPIIKELAAQIVARASDRKTIAFVPSVEIASLMAEALNQMGLKAFFVSGECIDKNEKTDAFAASGNGTVLVNCCLYTYGVDFQDVNCVAPLGAFISKVKYIQSVYRGTRVLPGVVNDAMTAEERVAAIAASKKPNLLVLSPFFISERHHICEPFDLFGEKPEGSKVRTKPDLTNPREIRDYIRALEKEADKHANRQPRTINPVILSVSLGIQPFVPQNAQDAAPPSKEELDFLLGHSVSSFDIKTSGQAQVLIQKLRLRDELGLCTPKQLQFLVKLGFPEDKAVTMKKSQAGAIIGRQTAHWHR